MKHSSEWPQMLYRVPGPHIIEGTGYALHLVHSADERDAAMGDGWHETTDAASTPVAQPAPAAADAPVASESAKDAPPTREELEEKARELNIRFDGRTSDKKLGEAIAAALKA